MPSDDEFRRVAEDLRTLVRSLARDVRQTAEATRQESRRAADAVRDEFGEAARQARQSIRSDRHRGYWWGGPRHHTGHHHEWHHNHRPDRGSRGSEGTVGATALEPEPARDHQHRRIRPQPRHHRDSSTVLGIVALVLGLSWLAASTHVLDVPWRGAVAVALMVLGAAMVVTARTDWGLSRRGWPVFLGAGLVGALALGSATVTLPSLGTHQLSWTSWDSVPVAVEAGVGVTALDMRGLGTLPQARTLQVRGHLGTVRIMLPADLRVKLDARSTIGTVLYNGTPQSTGFGQSVQRDLHTFGPGPPLTLEIRDVVGTVRIEQSLTASPVPVGFGGTAA